MGFFATAGAALAVDNGASWFAAALLGTLSAIAGSIVRDVRIDHLRRPRLPLSARWVLGTVWATALRLAAMIFHRRLPTGPHELIN
jgi:hypothetical protein